MTDFNPMLQPDNEDSEEYGHVLDTLTSTSLISNPECTMPGCASGQPAKYVFILDDPFGDDEEISAYRCRECLLANIAKDELMKSEIHSLTKL